MAPAPELSVVIPAYNEAERLTPAIEEMVAYFGARRMDTEILVVDDGSQDATSAVVRQLASRHGGIQLIRLAENGGKGFAVRSGVVNSRGRAVLFADADGATPIAELERLEASLAAGADIAIGSRVPAGGATVVKAKTYRHLIGRCFHHMVELLAIRGIHDTQCGFKLFTSAAAHDLFSRMRMRGFSFDVEVLVMAQLRGYEIREVPVNWHHVDGSRVNLLRDSVSMARDVFRIRALCLGGGYRVPRVAPWLDEAGAGR